MSTSDFDNNLLTTEMMVIRVKCERNGIRKSFFGSSYIATAIDFGPTANLHYIGNRVFYYCNIVKVNGKLFFMCVDCFLGVLFYVEWELLKVGKHA